MSKLRWVSNKISVRKSIQLPLMTELDNVSQTSAPSYEQISKFSMEYKQRRKQQMIRFFGATAVALISCRMAYRGVQSRRYLPHMFQLNYKHPPISYQGEAASALAMGTGLATGGFGMLIFGGCWIWDISSLKELSAKLGMLMGQKGEGTDKSLTNMPLDNDTAQVVNQLEELLNKK